MKIYSIKQLCSINYPKLFYYKYKDNPLLRIFYKWKSKITLKRLLASSSLFPIELDYVNEVNQVTHPDAFVASAKFDNQIILSVSGYPFGCEKYENQFVLRSKDGKHFDNVLINKAVVAYNGNGKSFYSDGEIIEFNDTIYLFYRFCDVDHGKRAISIFRIESSDLRNWKNEKLLLSGEGLKYISPTIVRQENFFVMYYVEQMDNIEKSVLKRKKSFDLEFHNIEKDEELLINNAPQNMMLWHIDVVSSNNILHGLFDFCTGNGGKCARLYYATSIDKGTSWDIHKEILLDIDYKYVSKIYRSTLVYYNNKWDMYVPVCTNNNCWFLLLMHDFKFEEYI